MKNFLRNIVMDKWQYKLASIILAIILWIYVVKEQNLNILLNIPVEIDNLPVNMEITNNFKNSLDVLIVGRRDDIAKIERKNIIAIIDLKKAQEGENIIKITRQNIKFLPNVIAIEEISPMQISIILKSMSRAPVQNTGGK
jgi:YbbR domain-containing protein